jgi:hypothetical protein
VIFIIGLKEKYNECKSARGLFLGLWVVATTVSGLRGDEALLTSQDHGFPVKVCVSLAQSLHSRPNVPFLFLSMLLTLGVHTSLEVVVTFLEVSIRICTSASSIAGIMLVTARGQNIIVRETLC